MGVFSSFVFSFIGPFAVSCLPFRSAVRFVVVVVRGALGRRLCRWGVGWCVLEWVFFCRAPFLPARGGVVMSVLLGAFRFVFSFFFSSGVT